LRISIIIHLGKLSITFKLLRQVTRIIEFNASIVFKVLIIDNYFSYSYLYHRSRNVHAIFGIYVQSVFLYCLHSKHIACHSKGGNFTVRIHFIVKWMITYNWNILIIVLSLESDFEDWSLKICVEKIGRNRKRN